MNFLNYAVECREEISQPSTKYSRKCPLKSRVKEGSLNQQCLDGLPCITSFAFKRAGFLIVLIEDHFGHGVRGSIEPSTSFGRRGVYDFRHVGRVMPNADLIDSDGHDRAHAYVGAAPLSVVAPEFHADLEFRVRRENSHCLRRTRSCRLVPRARIEAGAWESGERDLEASVAAHAADLHEGCFPRTNIG